MALHVGDITKVHTILENETDVNSFEAWGHPNIDLHMVIVLVGMVKCVLAHGVDINKKTPEGETMLSIAAEECNLPMVTLLLSYKEIDLSIKYDYLSGNTILHNAVIKNDNELIRMLVEAGADINVKNDNGVTPVAMSLQHYPWLTIDTLIELGADPKIGDMRGNNCLDVFSKEFVNSYRTWTASSEAFEVLCALFRHGCTDIEQCYDTEWVSKLLTREPRCMSEYLKSGGNPDAVDATGHPLIFHACKNGEADVVKLLLNAGASTYPVDPESRGCLWYWSIYDLSYGGDLMTLVSMAVLRTLLEYNVPITTHGMIRSVVNSAQLKADKGLGLEVMRLLLRGGCKITDDDVNSAGVYAPRLRRLRLKRNIAKLKAAAWFVGMTRLRIKHNLEPPNGSRYIAAMESFKNKSKQTCI